MDLHLLFHVAVFFGGVKQKTNIHIISPAMREPQATASYGSDLRVSTTPL